MRVRVKEILHRIDSQLQHQQLPPNVISTYAHLLQLCENAKQLEQGKEVHKHITNGGLSHHVLLRNHILHMYIACGSIDDAWQVFYTIPNRNAITWTRMIAATNVQLGNFREVFQHYQSMLQDGVLPDAVAFVTILGVCASAGPAALPEGECVHTCVMENGTEDDQIVGNALLHMYAKCGDHISARAVFDKMRRKDAISWTSMIAACAEHQLSNEALELFGRMQLAGIMPTNITLVTVLNAVENSDWLGRGMLLHDQILGRGFDDNVVMGNALINMYTKCGIPEYAQQVFDDMNKRDEISWNGMILAYTLHGLIPEAFTLFQQMLLQGAATNRTTFVTLINTCASSKALPQGKLLHKLMSYCGWESNLLAQNALISMYGKCDSLLEAQTMFENMSERDSVSWNAVISAFAHFGHSTEAMHFFKRMQLEGILPSKVTFLGVMNAVEEIAEGKDVHAHIDECGFGMDAIVANSVVNMYGKLGYLEDAYGVFERMNDCRLYAWNTMIAAYAQQGYFLMALKLYQQMQSDGKKPDKVTFATLLNACANTKGCLAEGKMLHSVIEDSGVEIDITVGNALINMYGKCGELFKAVMILRNLPHTDSVSWNTVIAAFAQNQRRSDALEMFKEMVLESFEIDKVTFVAILGTCDSPAFAGEVKVIHYLISESGYEYSPPIANTLIKTYAKCGSLWKGREIFEEMNTRRDVVSWNVMIVAYAESENLREAMELLKRMQFEGVLPSHITLTAILTACITPVDLLVGEMIHNRVVECGFDSDLIVSNALASMYSKCGRTHPVKRIFDGMQQRDLITWNAMLTCYINDEECEQSFICFRQMQLEGMKLDRVTFLNMLSMCAKANSIEKTLQVHGYRLQYGLQEDCSIGNVVIGILGRSGKVHEASKFFNEMSERDVISWNTLAAAYNQHGHTEEALQLFLQMMQEGFAPDHVTFVGVLTGCSHAGKVVDGCEHYHSMLIDHEIAVTMELCGCVIDLLGRAGWLNEAYEFMGKMKVEPNSVAWLTLLGACKMHGNIDLGKKCARKAIHLNPHDSAPFVVLSHIYREAGMLDEACRVREVIYDLKDGE